MFLRNGLTIRPGKEVWSQLQGTASFVPAVSLIPCRCQVVMGRSPPLATWQQARVTCPDEKTGSEKRDAVNTGQCGALSIRAVFPRQVFAGATVRSPCVVGPAPDLFFGIHVR